MRIVHTSDWHAGRIWRSLDRLAELERVLDHLARYTLSEKVDLLLMTGDVFDGGAPPAAAERVVFEFLKRVGQGGVPVVLIAGNHDNPLRLDAWGTFAELAGIRVVGSPRGPTRGGVIEIPTKSGELAVVAALPFATPRKLLTADDKVGDDALAAQKYADGVSNYLGKLTARFEDFPQAVRLVASHLFVEGAKIGGSERKVHVGSEWATTPQQVTTQAHYVALGHIHKPQPVPGVPKGEYAGSPMQLDFGEAGEAKSFVVVEARHDRPAVVSRVPYEGATPLHCFAGTRAEFEAAADDLRLRGHVRVVVDLEAPEPDFARKVRERVPNAVSVDVHLPERKRADRLAVEPDLQPRDAYRRWRATDAGPPDDALLAAFDELHDAASGGTP